MDFGNLKNVSVEDAIEYMRKMGYTENVHAKKMSDDLGPYIKMLGSTKEKNGMVKTFSVDMGEFLPRVYRENRSIHATPLGFIWASYWDNNYDAVIEKDSNGCDRVPEYIREWWTLVASKNPEQARNDYLSRMIQAYEWASNKPDRIAVVRETISKLYDKIETICSTSEDSAEM